MNDSLPEFGRPRRKNELEIDYVCSMTGYWYNTKRRALESRLPKSSIPLIKEDGSVLSQEQLTQARLIRDIYEKACLMEKKLNKYSETRDFLDNQTECLGDRHD